MRKRKDRWIHFSFIATKKIGLGICVLEIVVCTVAYEKLFASRGVPLCKHRHCMVYWVVVLQSIWFSKHHVERPSSRQNMRCIVICNCDRADIVEASHTTEFCWYQQSVEGLSIRAFCLSSETNWPISKVVPCNRRESFSKNFSAPRYFSFAIDNRPIVIAHWFNFPSILFRKSFQSDSLVFNGRGLYSHYVDQVVLTMRSICIKINESKQLFFWP